MADTLNLNYSSFLHSPFTCARNARTMRNASIRIRGAAAWIAMTPGKQPRPAPHLRAAGLDPDGPLSPMRPPRREDAAGTLYRSTTARSSATPCCGARLGAPHGSNGLPPLPRGRAHRELTVEYIRDLAPADLALLEVERGIKPPGIKQLRDSHHALARILSMGTHPAEASLITGYSLSRISILQGDPTFRELLKFYRGRKEEVVADVLGRMSAVHLEALAELQERLHDTAEQFTPGMLLEIVKTLADRTGYGPQPKSTNTSTTNIGIAVTLERARQRVIEHLDAAPGAAPMATEVLGGAALPRNATEVDDG